MLREYRIYSVKAQSIIISHYKVGVRAHLNNNIGTMVVAEYVSYYFLKLVDKKTYK